MANHKKAKVKVLDIVEEIHENIREHKEDMCKRLQTLRDEVRTNGLDLKHIKFDD
jgi:hypothetical protein